MVLICYWAEKLNTTPEDSSGLHSPLSEHGTDDTVSSYVCDNQLEEYEKNGYPPGYEWMKQSPTEYVFRNENQSTVSLNYHSFILRHILIYMRTIRTARRTLHLITPLESPLIDNIHHPLQFCVVPWTTSRWFHRAGVSTFIRPINRSTAPSAPLIVSKNTIGALDQTYFGRMKAKGHAETKCWHVFFVGRGINGLSTNFVWFDQR